MAPKKKRVPAKTRVNPRHAVKIPEKHAAIPPRYQHIGYGAGDVRGEEDISPPPPPAPPGGGGGGGGGGGQHHEIVPGLDAADQAKIDQIFQRWGDNQDAAMREAISYLMTTTWFAQNYAGYATGVQKSLWDDPFSGGLAQYRDWKNSAQASYRQHYGREATNDELIQYINSGYKADRVERAGVAHSTIVANAPDWNYLSGAFGGGMLTDAEKQAYADEIAGVDTALGQQIKSKVDAALQRMQGVFQGQLGSSGLQDQQIGQRLQKPKDIQA